MGANDTDWQYLHRLTGDSMLIKLARAIPNDSGRHGQGWQGYVTKRVTKFAGLLARVTRECRGHGRTCARNSDRAGAGEPLFQASNGGRHAILCQSAVASP